MYAVIYDPIRGYTEYNPRILPAYYTFPVPPPAFVPSVGPSSDAVLAMEQTDAGPRAPTFQQPPDPPPAATTLAPVEGGDVMRIGNAPLPVYVQPDVKPKPLTGTISAMNPLGA